MSFSSQLKKQIAQTGEQCLSRSRAEAYGFLIFSRLPEGEGQSLRTEQLCVAERAAELLAAVCGVYVDITEYSGKTSEKQYYKVSLPDYERGTVMEHFGLSGNERVQAINEIILEDDACRDAFLRGAFLAAGQASSPDKSYRLELSCRSEGLAAELQSLLGTAEINSGVTCRRDTNVVYIKERESIERFLADIGAGNAYYEFVNLMIYRDIRNDVNRRTNFEQANLSKTVNASAEQVAAIRYIEKTAGLCSLPEELREIAKLRVDNPDWTLRQLGEALSVPLSRSGVNHRLERLIRLAEENGYEK